MKQYRVEEVKTKKEIMDFIKFPHSLYKSCKQYVPALNSDQYRLLTKVSTLKYCERCLWVVKDGDEIVGRICAMINPRYNQIYNKKRARFGWFDTINDIEVARLLLSTAEQWAKSKGMTEVHGPLYYNTLGKQGMLIEGYENTPPFNCLYNYPYYNQLVESLGYTKECDWLQYKMRADQDLDPKILRISSLLQQKYNLHAGKISQLKKDKNLVKEFFRMYNESFANTVYNFIPFTDEEIAEESKFAIPFLDDKTSTIILDEDNNLAAFGIAFPSISEALKKCKGRLFPFGWFYLWRAIKNVKEVDLMINGAIPKWQNTGVSAVFHTEMSKRCKQYGIEWAIANPQIETNSAVNVWQKYDNELYMRRRCYIKQI